MNNLADLIDMWRQALGSCPADQIKCFTGMQLQELTSEMLGASRVLRDIRTFKEDKTNA